MKKRVLVLGAGVMQGPALRIAHGLGLETVAVDGNALAPCRHLADRFEPLDLKAKDAILALARTLAAEAGGLAGVFTAGTDFSAPVAYIAEKLGLPGIPHEAALDASDKERMRTRFAAAAVPSPAFLVVRETPGADFRLPFAFPVVVKPVDNMGARGCRRADDIGELRAACAAALPHSRSSRVIVEEFIDGPEYSVDALVYQGRITICGLAERHIFFPPYFIEMGHTMPASLFPDARDAIIDVFTAGIRALGLDNGAAKGDIKLSTKGPVIGEIAARLSGGYMSGWTYPYASGADSTRGALSIACGEPPEGITPRRDWVSAERAFISIPGTLVALHGVEDARCMEGVKDVFVRVAVGERLRFPLDNVSKCGNVISAAPERDTAIAAAENAVRKIIVELAVCDAATDAFLAEPLDSAFPPSAFGITDEIAAALAVLPEGSGQAGNELSPVPFPLFAESGLTDYVGRTVAASLAAVATLTGLSLRLDGEGSLGRGFWHALIRGGCQGAAYYVASSRRQAPQPYRANDCNWRVFT